MEWGPRPAETALAAGLAAVLAVLAAAADPAGRVLFGVGAVWLAAVAVLDLVLRPRLRVDVDGVTVRTLSGRRRLRWAAVQRVRVDERSRHGLTGRALEVDADETVVVLGRRALGADPRDVAATVARFRAASGH